MRNSLPYLEGGGAQARLTGAGGVLVDHEPCSVADREPHCAANLAVLSLELDFGARRVVLSLFSWNSYGFRFLRSTA